MNDEFKILDEIQVNCSSDVEKFSKLLPKLDPELSEKINSIIDNLNLTNFNINNVKNNIAMKLYQREINLQHELRISNEAQGKLEEKEKELEKKINEVETECISLKYELEKEKEPKEKPKFDAPVLRDFKKREIELKNHLSSELQKWSKIKADLTDGTANWDKDSESAIVIEEVNKELEGLESELADIEKNLKGKATKNRAALSKKRTNIKQKITRTKKKYETIKKDLKKGSKNSVKLTELKNEFAQIINDIESLEYQYNDILSHLEFSNDELYYLFQDLPGITFKETKDESSKTFDKLLNQSLEREKKLQQQLETANKNVEELQSELKSMDTDYYAEVKKEFERLFKKREKDLKSEFEQKMKLLDKGDFTKIENNYKKEIKKSEDKYKKDLELAAQRVFELKQYIANLEQGMSPGGKVTKGKKSKIPKKSVSAQAELAGTFNIGSEPTMTSSIEPIGEQGLPLRMPKQEVVIQSTTPFAATGKKKKKQKKKKSAGQKEPKAIKAEQMAQCGACGEYISVESNACPNCGVSFTDIEEELGACGNCGNFIPVTMKKCPICGVTFE